MILLAVTTDGRGELLEQTLTSFEERVSGVDGPRVIFDDSGDRGYRKWLRSRFEPDGYSVVAFGPDRLGQGKALARVWDFLGREAAIGPHRYVFFCEDDFLFERDIDLDAMRSVLEARPYLAQMALLRQPWFPGEVKAGGIVERDPDEYERVPGGWLEHRLWFTLNPCLFRRELCKMSRPIGKRHEWNFSRRLCRDPEVRFGIWGNGSGSEPWVRHIGEQRVGVGY